MDINQQYLMGLWIPNDFESNYSHVSLSSKIIQSKFLFCYLHDFKFRAFDRLLK